MKPILGREGRAALESCRGRGALLAFDFDGTLAPIVADPARAALRPSTRRLLARLARRQPCAVISGRSPEDLAERLQGIELVERVGNHGVAYGLRPAARAMACARVARWRVRLSERLAGRPGIVIEDNGLSLAVHYRLARDRDAARRAIGRAIATLRGARVLDGKCVVNLLPAGKADKGQVLRRLARTRRASHVLFVGDDLTDEAAFATLVAPYYVTVRVGSGTASAARFSLSGQRRVDELLRVLAPPIGGRRAALGARSWRRSRTRR